MSTLVRSALIALVLATGATAAMAQPARNSEWTDMSKPHGGYNPNSQEGHRAFWDYQTRQGD